MSVRSARAQEAGEVSVFAGALLVRREEIDTVGALLAALQEEHPAARIRFLGPWPPYSFTELLTARRRGAGGGRGVTG
ncbi:GvpL/GvpF family gas vesicle protein [Streptomyces albus]|nr:GvpL/GvpF family gas vesicle protein [Streptomyces albus]